MLTFKQLSQLYYLQIEISGIEKYCKELNEKLYNLQNGNLDGMPKGSNFDRGYIDNIIDLIIEQDRLIADLKTQAEREKIKLIKFISTVDDSFIRQILMFRFLKLYSWQKVATLVGGGNTSDSVRMACKRFLKKL